MSLIVQLENFGITKDQISTLSESEIIRIEKKLKAEARFNEALSTNDVDTIVYALRNYQQELSLFYTADFDILRRIISAPSRAYVANLTNELPLAASSERFRQFIEESFSNEIYEFIESCIQNDFYNALYSLVQFKACLSAQLLDRLQSKLAAKIVFATECIRINAKSLETKIDFSCNPFLYRILTQLGAGQFDNEIRDLLNTSLRHSIDTNLKYRLIYAMGFFLTSDANMADLLKSNQEIAYRKGVREVLISSITKRKTGSTAIDKDLIHKPVINTQQSTKTVYQGRHESNGSIKNSGSIIFGIVMVVIFFIRMISYNSDSSHNYSSDFYDQDRFNKEFAEDYEKRLREKKKEELRQIIENAEYKPEIDPYSNDFEDIVTYLNSDSATIVKTENIPLRIDKTGLNKRTKFDGGVENVTIKNQTFERMLIMIESPKWERWEFIEHGDSLVVSNISRQFRVYTGSDPEMVTYLDGNGDTKRHFRFRNVSTTALETCHKKDTFHSIFYETSAYSVIYWYDDRRLRYSINGEE